MDLKIYQENAQRTMNWSLESNVQLASMALGIAGETGEVFKVVKTDGENAEKIKDEASDIFWYAANTCTLLSLDWRTLFPTEYKIKAPYTTMADASIYAAEVADTVKKTVAQRHVLDIEKIVESLQGLIDCLCRVLAYYNLTPQEVCAYNQQKLLRRFPEGFEASRSINREE